MSDALLARWDAFLGKIRGTYDQLMADGRAGCLELLNLEQLETIAMSNAWMGIRSEVHALTSKLNDTWNGQVEPAFESAGVPRDQILVQDERCRALNDEMTEGVQRQEVVVFAEAADRVLAAARAISAKGFRCTQCGGELPVPKEVFRSLHVTCEYCGRVNTSEPGSHVRAVQHFCSHYLSQRAALTEWGALEAVNRRRRRGRGDSIEVLRDLEAATRVYWTAYFRARAGIVPEYAKDLDRDIDSRLRPFRDEMAHNTVWQANVK